MEEAKAVPRAKGRRSRGRAGRLMQSCSEFFRRVQRGHPEPRAARWSGVPSPPLPTHRHGRAGRWYLPEQSWWNYKLLLRASCNGKVSDYYHMKRRALFFIYLQDCSLEKVTHTHTHRSAHSVFSKRRAGDAERCTLQHTENKRKLCEKLL